MRINEENNESIIEDRAHDFRQTIEDCFIDESGLLQYNINIETMRPFTEEELEPFEITASGSTKAGRWTYEDTMFCSGLYLWSLVEEFKVTGNVEIKSKAEHFFENLTKVLDKSDQIESGYIGKPWGGEPSLETTLDQTLYLCFGLHAFCSISEGEYKEQASRIIIRNTDWWIRRNYKNFQAPSDVLPVWLLPSHVGAMMAQVYLSTLHSQDDKYFKECQRLIKLYEADAFDTRRSVTWLPVDHQGRKVRGVALWHHAMAFSQWLFIHEWTDRKKYWQERFVEQWHKELKLGLRPDGMTDMCVRVNLATETETPFNLGEAGFLGELTEWHITKNATGWRWTSAMQSGYFSCHVALSACLLADTVPWMREPATEVVKSVRDNIDLKKHLWAYDPDGKQVYEKRKHWTKSLTSKGLSAWLLTYWMARRIKLIG